VQYLAQLSIAMATSIDTPPPGHLTMLLMLRCCNNGLCIIESTSLLGSPSRRLPPLLIVPHSLGAHRTKSRLNSNWIQSPCIGFNGPNPSNTSTSMCLGPAVSPEYTEDPCSICCSC